MQKKFSPAMDNIFTSRTGDSPVLISIPHDGTRLPAELEGRLTASARELPDTDWLVSELYNFIDNEDFSLIKANYSRYVVDLNRSGHGEQLYPGRFETSVCPTLAFSGQELYRPGQEPDDAEIAERITTYWQPYHDQIRSEIQRIQALHGYAILWDAHSIYGEIPGLFDGVLPDLNFGTANNTSLGLELREQIMNLAAKQREYSWVMDGRFKGGYITRCYGNPGKDIHAVQLEINQSAYLDSTRPPAVDTGKTTKLSQQILIFINMLQARHPA